MVSEQDESLDDLSLALKAEIDQQNAGNQNTENGQQANGQEPPPTGEPQNQPPAQQPPVTQPTDTPPAAPETTTTEEVIGDPDDWHNKKPAAETISTATQTQAGQKAPEADPVYEKYKTALNDPQVQFLLDQKLAGKSIFEVQKEFQFIDYDNLPAADLFKEKLQKFGASDDDVKEELEAFSQLKPWEQAEKVASLREQGKQAQAQKMANLNQSAQQSQQQQHEFQQRINSEITQTIESLKGKELFNLKVSDDAINRALPMVLNGMPGWKKANGEPNIAQIFEDIIFLNERSAIVKQSIKRAEAKGAKAIATEIVNGSKNHVAETGSVRQSTLSIEDEAAAMDKEDERRYNRAS